MKVCFTLDLLPKLMFAVLDLFQVLVFFMQMEVKYFIDQIIFLNAPVMILDGKFLFLDK